MANLINQQQDQFDDLEAKAETVELETGKGCVFLWKYCPCI